MTAITERFYHDLQAWYLAYAESFFSNDDQCQHSIILKRNHSIRVAALCGLISKQLGWSDEEVLLARTVGLLHDIARFEQYSQFGTFRDPLSFDHGDRGAELLTELEIPSSIDTPTLEVIDSAVRYHNKPQLPTDLPEHHLAHTRMVRDADKLDIIYLTCKGIRNGSDRHHFSGLGRNGQLTPEVMRSLTEKKYVDYNQIRTGNDFQLLKIGWVYDLNYTPSLALLQKRKHLEELKATLPGSRELESVLSRIDNHMFERLQQPAEKKDSTFSPRPHTRKNYSLLGPGKN